MPESLRVLLTNNTLAGRAGTELYVRDVALGLLARGHRPVAYSTHLGAVAADLRAATVPVVDDLANLADAPDVIHGHHHLDTLAALLYFPGVPAVAFCHGWAPWQEEPLRFPRIRRYVAVDRTCRDRLVCEHGVPPERVALLPNFVDLGRFRPRPPLPPRPRRALVFSNYASAATHLHAAQRACAARGLAVDVCGAAAGTATDRPEDLLPGYDLVVAKARAALEALAVGCAVILCDATGAGPFVTPANFDDLRALNFGVRALNRPLDAATLAAEIDRYDAAAAAEVSRRVRAEAGLNAALDRLLDLYRAAIAENHPAEPMDEMRAAAAYWRRQSMRLKELDVWQGRTHAAEAAAAAGREEVARIGAELDGVRGEQRRLNAEVGRLHRQLADLYASTALRTRDLLRRCDPRRLFRRPAA